MKRYLETGKIVGTHGVHGEMRVQPWCDEPAFLLPFKYLYLDGSGGGKLSVLSCRQHGNIVLLKVREIDSMEKAQEMRGKTVYIDRNDAKLNEGDYFIQDLIGCRVVDSDDGRLYGILTDIGRTGSNDVWQVTSPDKNEYLIPAISDVVIDVDIENETVKIRPLKGIFDDED